MKQSRFMSRRDGVVVNRRRALRALLSVMLSGSLDVHADTSSDSRTYPTYAPGTPLEGVVRIWGHGSLHADYIGALVKSWATGFGLHHPGVRFEVTLRGNGTALGGLYTGAADVAIMDRAPLEIELDGYRSIQGSNPFEVSIATGSLDVPDHAAAPVVFVHRSNPLRKLTLAQLDAIIGADHRRGAENIRRWGQLGLTREWADAPIRVLAPAIHSDVSRFLQQLVMLGSQKWTDDLHEFDIDGRSYGPLKDVDQAITHALAKDRFGIAISSQIHGQSGVQAVSLAVTAHDSFISPTRQTVQRRTYPLARSVSAFVNRSTTLPLEPRLAAFLRYVLSAEGQALVGSDGGYLPLTQALARNEWSKLD